MSGEERRGESEGRHKACPYRSLRGRVEAALLLPGVKSRPLA